MNEADFNHIADIVHAVIGFHATAICDGVNPLVVACIGIAEWEGIEPSLVLDSLGQHRKETVDERLMMVMLVELAHRYVCSVKASTGMNFTEGIKIECEKIRVGVH